MLLTRMTKTDTLGTSAPTSKTDGISWGVRANNTYFLVVDGTTDVDVDLYGLMTPYYSEENTEYKWFWIGKLNASDTKISSGSSATPINFRLMGFERLCAVAASSPGSSAKYGFIHDPANAK